jgi:hypothetical protein
MQFYACSRVWLFVCWVWLLLQQMLQGLAFGGMAPCACMLDMPSYFLFAPAVIAGCGQFSQQSSDLPISAVCVGRMPGENMWLWLVFIYMQRMLWFCRMADLKGSTLTAQRSQMACSTNVICSVCHCYASTHSIWPQHRHAMSKGLLAELRTFSVWWQWSCVSHITDSGLLLAMFMGWWPCIRLM